MLSKTNTIVDVKERLRNDYSFYSFSSDEVFEDALETIADDVKELYLVPRITIEGYEEVEEKDKIDLSRTEKYVYFAEVYLICFEFLKSVRAINGQLQDSGDEHLAVEGYTYRSRASAGRSPGDISLGEYWGKAVKYFKLAGYDLMALERTCTIFGD